MKRILIISVLLLNALLAYSQVTYQYDNLNRLQKVEYAGGVTIEYTYDELGNRLTKTVSGNVAVTGVSLNKTAVSLSVNGTEQLTATVVPDNATNKSVKWSSSNPSVATVSDGLVTAVSSGAATVTVATEDENKTATCTVTVRSNDATLSSLTVSAGTLSPAFSAGITSYTVDVDNSVTSINVAGAANHAAATVSGNVTGKTLDIGNNTATLAVTAEDGTTRTYTVTIVRAASSDATLSSLTVSSGTLPFNPATTSYTVNVANDVTVIDITGTANYAAATVSGNVTGKTLDVGDNTIKITVTAENGTTAVIYTVTIHRLSNDATLSSLTLSSGELLFDSSVTGYTVNVPNEITAIDVTGTAHHSLAKVTGNVANMTLKVGDNTALITVTAEDGTTVKVYTVTVVRASSSDARLKGLTVSAGSLSFDANTTSYTVNVANDVTVIDVTGTANHSSATVSGNVSNKSLNVGSNEVSITVTAEDGTTKIYTVTIVRADRVFETEAALISIITANGNEITVSGNTIEYAAPCGETSFDLDLQTSPYSTVTVDNVEYPAGESISLASDDGTSNIRVQAETGGAVNNYTLNVTAPINDSRLYYQRWDDVIAINLNPATNGGYDVSEIRWYGQDGELMSNEGYIIVGQGAAPEDYYAEIRTEGKLRQVCNDLETKSPEKVVAYPNPVPRGESVQLKLPESFAGSVLDIYDIKGRLVKSGLPLPVTGNSVSVSDLDSGIYLLHITGKEGKRQVIKIIIE
jgi:YD repeat-containing protein